MPATLKSRIPQINASLKPRVDAAVHASVERMALGAAERAPQESGDLAESYEARKLPTGSGIYAAWYWLFPEFGTSHSAAQPHLIPAVEQERGPMEAEVAAALRGL